MEQTYETCQWQYLQLPTFSAQPASSLEVPFEIQVLYLYVKIIIDGSDSSLD